MSDNELTEDYIVKTDVDVMEYVDKYIKNIKQTYIKISIILIYVIGLFAITYRHILFYLFFLLTIFCVFGFIIDYIRIREYKDKALLKSYDLVVGKIVNHEESFISSCYRSFCFRNDFLRQKMYLQTIFERQRCC